MSEVNKIKNYCKLLVVALLLLSVCGCLSVHTDFVYGQTSQTQNELQAANAAINRAFISVNAAEKVGANVTSLLSALNNITNTLAQADNAYRAGASCDFSQVNQVILTANQLASSAQDIKEAAILSNETSFWSTIIVSVFLSLILVLILYFAWRFFKRWYLCDVNMR